MTYILLGLPIVFLFYMLVWNMNKNLNHDDYQMLISDLDEKNRWGFRFIQKKDIEGLYKFISLTKKGLLIHLVLIALLIAWVFVLLLWQ